MIKCSPLCFLLSLFFIQIILLSFMLILTTSNQKNKNQTYFLNIFYRKKNRMILYLIVQIN